ncbi:MAG: lactonase family protein [Sphingomonas sp.]|uniref:lactonase family protein n=1 Tax=Sphingomonas sp. TaxID=28214 RepID=UPI002275FC58|nr:lactonase family protein [Sphingomonas sp.]MCX8477829.1 lactonase family protein [Sphingomonas sp.]
MAVDRRTLLCHATLLAATTLAACAPRAGVEQSRNVGDLFFIGTHGTQVHATRLDPRSGEMTTIGPVADVPNPTWAVRHPDLPVLYVASQLGGDGKSEGSVVAFRIDPETGALARTGEAKAGGGGTTHLWFDTASRTLLAANYASGSVASIAVHADGSLGERVSLVQATGTGPHRRQASPHAHGVAVDPSGRFALVADLGADRIFVYPLARRTHALADGSGPARHLALPPGTGPRHFAFHPNGRFVYLLGELTAEIFTLRWDAASGTLSQVQALSTDAPGFAGNRSVAEVAVSRDGRFVYASNRGDSAIVVHAIDPRTGTLRQIQRIPSGGATPWSFAIHPGGRWMIVANEKSDRLNLFRIDPSTGTLSDTGKTLPIPKPVSVTFAGTR